MSESAGEKQPPVNRGSQLPRPKTWWEPYWKLARMHKFPSGSMVVFWPHAFGYVMATREKPEPLILAAYMLGFFLLSTILHSAACVINDICDRDFDRQVERCKTRPLAAGTVSMFGAWVFLFLQLIPFFGMLSYLNSTAFIVGTFGVFAFDACYPLMKRVTNWPQAWLGIAINWGVPTAWLAVAPNDLKSDAMWVLFLGTWCWTIVYDTVYACQDRKDDIKAGVKSTAVLFGSWVKPILCLFAIGFVAALAYTGLRMESGLLYFAVTVGGSALHLAWQMITWDTEDPKDCWNKFVANGNLGYIVFAGMVADLYYPDPIGQITLLLA